MRKRIYIKARNEILHFFLAIFAISIVYTSCDNKTVRPDTVHAKVTIANPLQGEKIDTTTTIAVEVDPPNAVEKVDFYVDGELIGADDEQPYEKAWYVGFWAEDSVHTIFVEAKDTSGTIIGSDSLIAIVDSSAIIVPEIIFPEDGHVVTEPGLFIVQLYRIEGATEYTWHNHPMQIDFNNIRCDDEICRSTEMTYYSGCSEVNWRLYIHTPGKTILRRYTYYVAISCGD